MSNSVLLALGGNAILCGDASAAAQRAALRETCKSIRALVADGYEVTITHGNGPQVGNLYLQQHARPSEKNPPLPLDACVAMTQGSIGYWLQNALSEELRRSGIEKNVVSLITQVEVDAADEAFSHPTKPIGPFLTKDAAAREAAALGGVYAEDAGRGWRRVVPSPRPVGVLEVPVIRRLLGGDSIVVCAGGGGVPVLREAYGWRGVEAVIDKDLVSARLAEQLQSDILLIVTGVDNVYIDYNKPTQRRLERVSADELERYIADGQFAPGSMLPKAQAALRFVRGGKNRRAVITSIQNMGALRQGAGTHIVNS